MHLFYSKKITAGYTFKKKKYYDSKKTKFCQTSVSKTTINYISKVMFQKGSFSIPSDSSGVLLVKVIQTRRCSTRKHADIGKFLRVVLKYTKVKLNKRRKRKVRAIVIRSQRYYFRTFGMYYQFANNSLVLLKKRMNTMGKELYGPTSKALKIRKFRIAFKYIF